MTIPQRKFYTGTEKSLVIGIDIGTTLSGVSYALREPGKVPRIQPVTRFSGQKEENSNSKVPSVVSYYQDGNIIDTAPDEGLSEMESARRAQWFKLRLWPPYLDADKRSQLEKLWSPPEPAEAVFQVFADFLQYLFKSAKEYIIESEIKLDPTFTWSTIERNIFFVLTHPNGWEGKQQSQIRDAAVAAGLVNSSAAANQITFVTEGEANLHFCLEKIPELHQESGGLLVVDCGGGTIGLNTYSQTENGGFKEIASPDCLVQGSIFVTSRARDYFKGKFKDSTFGTDDDVEAMARAFDKPDGVKCMFQGPNKPSFVNFGCLRYNDKKYGISGGKFKIEGAQVAKFFEPAVQDIITGIKKQCRNAKDGVSITHILLVGGFGRSQYLFTKLSDYFKTSGIVVRRPNDDQDPSSCHLKVTAGRRKEVADGAVSWYLDRCVSARVARYSYGVAVDLEFDPSNPEHACRESTKFTYVNGKSFIPGGFLTMLKRDAGVFETTESRRSLRILFTQHEYSRCSSIHTNLKCYRGQVDDPPKWIDLEPNSFHDLCTIQANMTRNIKRNMKWLRDSDSKLFYELNLDLVILFGSTELKVYIAWQENGTEKRYACSVDDGIRDS
ncbi:hypothetical protein M378DRAFT_134237 [Amanita muscaria Koide BX008]|uniref:Uncharacterized protein n=1 Tax=Amanita muscaria (strain Koide BX008) TaxID=946122 RepID=A0A0C2SMN6_AMAMK|nr:hypothetical protein M378DRAFT_134237 [Amanita muscaria Koide BX008]